ncbi:hypothetical protein RJ639_034284 [Escallonia herrerae]|uniref:Uncharacterized protein n=1 Tax=Escallonia herrerae TaxID=1293975 RepID=A0AA88WVK8_9ASTE|nr:hypothetical protein RJ639_034284 [Escallonia herrerae]
MRRINAPMSTTVLLLTLYYLSSTSSPSLTQVPTLTPTVQLSRLTRLKTTTSPSQIVEIHHLISSGVFGSLASLDRWSWFFLKFLGYPPDSAIIDIAAALGFGSAFLITMERFGGLGFSGMSRTTRKKRSNMSRRPRNDSQSFSDNGDTSQLSLKHSSYTLSKASSNETTGHGIISQGKQLNLNQCSSRASYTNFGEAETILKTSDGDGRFGEIR